MDALKNPGAQVSHLGCAEADPDVLVYMPGGHLVWAVQASVVLLEKVFVKNPVAHSLHLGCVVEEPAVLVYWPGGHFL